MNIPFYPILANPFGPQGIFILFVLLLLFGAKKLPELAKGLGQAIREFSKAKNDIHDEIMRDPPPRIEAPPVQATVNSQPAGTHPVSTPQTGATTDHPGARV